MSEKKLFENFNPVSAKEWKQKIQFDLKGADYNDTLVWESPEGIKVKPFYHADYEVAPFHHSKNSTWNIGRSIYVKNGRSANDKAKLALEKGTESLYFIVPSDEIDSQALLEGLNNVAIYFEFQFLSVEYVKSILQSAKNTSIHVFLNIDIIGHLAKTGNWYENLQSDHKKQYAILALEAKHCISVDMGLYQNAGANMVQQLAYGIAHANEYLNHVSDGVSSAQQFTFKVAVGTNYFFEIAKLRALRLLWKTLAASYDMHTDCHIIATPTKRNKTLYDYNTNLLRTTTECMSAVLGGADMVLNMPYDAIYHKENDFGNRIALNQLLLLKGESYFDKVENAAEGAYYIESLTRQLAEKSLLLFKQIEKDGGFLKQLKNNAIQKKIKENAQKEEVRFGEGKEVLVGTNKYVNGADRMKDSIELYPFVKTKPRKTLLEPIIEKRLAEDVEQKRLDDE
ncbi:methylmalonyl-CoA mutase subunit beta [Maribacter sp. 2210JD10-5]|uniref:methylmalonyl-CoA mutase subunit beta n=1 Tax=Maribacter sp. 2210JD10-5 TaxID=3386272 RepID=UPI0039BCA6F4